jgi:hypothetical protein
MASFRFRAFGAEALCRLAHQFRCTFASAADALKVLLGGLGKVGFREQDITRPENGRQVVVEVMRNTSRELADHRQTL